MIVETNTNFPLVSVVIPVYNAQKYIVQTLVSIVQQTYINIEIIIVLDGSKDQSEEIIRDFSNKNSQFSWTIISKRNTGVSDTRNLGMKNANGDFIALLDADDIWLPNNLSTKMEFLLSNSDVDFVFSNMNYVDENGLNPKPADSGKDSNILIDLLSWNGEVIPGPSSNLVFKRNCISKCLFHPTLSTIADQHFTVLLAKNFKGKMLQDYTWNYRIVKGSMSKSLLLQEKDALRAFLIYYKLGFFNDKIFFLKSYSKMFSILAGSWWKDGNNKLRAFDFIFKSVFFYPLSLKQLSSKWNRK